MSFQYVPGLIRIPKNPKFTPPDGVWRGVDSDEGYYVFRGNGSWGSYLMVKDPNFCPYLLVDGSRYEPVFSDVNGYMYWRSGSSAIYYSLSWGWICAAKFPGYEPIEYSEKDSETGETVYKGDSFYEIRSIPGYEDSETTMTPRGAIRGKEAKKLGCGWERWVGNEEFGEYEGKGGASGKRIFGLPQFKGNYETFLRSLKKENYYFRYGRIHCVNGKWVIGEIGSAGGWHEGSEPKAGGGSVTFKFCKNEDSDAKGSDISVSFDKYVQGEEPDTAYLGEVAIWR